jgi:branched-chain amino acid transport system permease protein
MAALLRYRPYLLGALGLAALTFPFLWLQLAPDYATNTVRVTWAFDHGLKFFTDLLPVFAVALLIWAVNRAGRAFGWRAAIERTAAYRRTAAGWAAWGNWLAMALALSGTLFLSSSNLSMLTNVGIYMLLALGLNITVGMTGLLVLGYAAFYGLGAYVFALGQQGLPFFPWWLAIPVAFLIGGGAGYLLGLPCLRLRGDYLAIVTLGFAEAFRELMRNLDVTGSDKGIILQDQAMFRGCLGLTHGQVAYLLTALLLFAAVFLVERIYHSPIGRAWVAIRENEIAAASVGVPVVQMKLLAFSLSAAVAAVAGVLYGAKDGFVSPAMCEFQQSITILAMVILGGLGNSYGALLGAALLYLVPEYLKSMPNAIQESGLGGALPSFLLDSFRDLADYRLLIFGAVMVLMMLYRPQGLLGSRRRKTEMQHA